MLNKVSNMFEVTVNNKQLYINDGKPLLDSIIENGYNVRHSCRSGRCKECTAKLIIDGKHKEILSCEYVPQPDEKFNFDMLEKFVLPQKQIFPAKIKGIDM